MLFLGVTYVPSFPLVAQHLVPIQSRVRPTRVIVAATFIARVARALVATYVPILQNAGTQADPLRGILRLVSVAFTARLPAHLDR
jgi:hypothetical protein